MGPIRTLINKLLFKKAPGERALRTLENAGDGFLCLDNDWTVSYISPSSLSKEELIGRKIFDVFPELEDTQFGSIYKYAKASGKPVHYEGYWPASDKWYELHVCPDEQGLCVHFKDITSKKREAESTTRKLHHEQKIAETLQKAIISSVPEEILGTLEVKSVYKPTGDEAYVGGDFYDVHKLSRHQFLITLGDASGKGIKAAARTAEIKYSLRALVAYTSSLPESFRSLNNLLSTLAARDEEEFVALSSVLIDTKDWTCRVVVAGAESPVIIRTSHTESIDVGGMPIGLWPGEEYSSYETSLAPGDTICLFTDGLTEVRRGKVFYGPERIAETARRHIFPGANLHTAGEKIIEDAASFGGGVFRDDVCLLLIRRVE